MGVSFVDQWRNNVGICRFRRGSIEFFNLNAVTNIFFFLYACNYLRQECGGCELLCVIHTRITVFLVPFV